jgi:phage/plasmid-associated DNA primase
MQEIICSGNEEHYRYLIGWCAHCVQHPEKQAEVAVVLRGLKGTGKGTLAQVIMRIFRNHSLHITHSRHLVGNFNAHLFDALFLFVDEAFWGGDKQGEGVLKGLITEDMVQLEPKGVDSFSVRNRVKIMIASNNDWVVPATGDERRFFMPTVSDARKGDRAYFNALYKALDEGETAAFLDFLLKYDLSAFCIRDVSHTEELNKQKLVGADSVTRFWEDCLREGAIIGHIDADWPEHIPTQALHLCYTEHARTHGERYPAIDARMAERIEELCKGCSFKRVRLPATADGKRPWGRELDGLNEHREAFKRALNMVDGYSWPGEEQ